MNPTPKQAEFLAYARWNRDKPIAWLGSVRAGKSIGALMALIEYMKRDGGSEYFVSAASATNIEGNLWPNFIRLLVSQNIAHEEKRWGGRHINTPWGKVWFLLAVDSGSQRVIQGLTLSGGVSDEILLYPRNFVMQLVSRFSLADPLWIFTANKSEPNHWIKVDWIDTNAVHVFESSHEDNPHISDTARQWWDTLLTGSYKGRMMDNEWTAELGMIGAPQMGPFNFIKQKTTIGHSIWIDHARNNAFVRFLRYKHRMAITAIYSDFSVSRIEKLALNNDDGLLICNLPDPNKPPFAGRCAFFRENIEAYARHFGQRPAGLTINLHDKASTRMCAKDFMRWSWVASGDTDMKFKPDQTTPEVLACVQAYYHVTSALQPFSAKGV